MTNKEAAEVIKNNAVPSFPLKVDAEMWEAAKDKAIEALEKQIPISILGTAYTIEQVEKCEDEGGLTDYVDKVITLNKNACKVLKERSLRHELVHAFLYESGLALAYDEIIVDWLATQFPKIERIIRECEVEMKNWGNDND